MIERCNHLIKCAANCIRPCQRPKYHKHGHNPFSDMYPTCKGESCEEVKEVKQETHADETKNPNDADEGERMFGEEMLTKEQINALACALAIMRETAGGYSPTEKRAAELELDRMYSKAIADFKE